MENKPLISPGTAGIAQRIPTNEKNSKVSLKILRRNSVEPCGQNQY